MTAATLEPLDTEAWVRAQWRRYFAPRSRVSPDAWCDRWRWIAKGPEKGPWQTARTPYLREPMRCMSPDSGFEQVVMQFATQLGKTEVLYNTAFHRLDIDPCDMMIVQPTLTDAKQHSRTRWAPTVAKMPRILARLPKSTSRDQANTWDTKEIDGGAAALFFAGANSARSLASKPLALAMCDEIDGYPADVDGEGNPIDLVRERLSNYANRRLLLCSTPTITDFSAIETAYLSSDRRRYHVPCPHCGGRQRLVWGADTEWGIKWLKAPDGSARLDTVGYVCMHCGASIDEHHKTDMLADGEWIAEAPGAGDGLIAGFQLSKLYSPLGWKSWRSLVHDWQLAREKQKAGDTTKLKSFVNLTLAETYRDDGEGYEANALARRAEPWALGTVPRGGLVLVQSVDVQGNRLEAAAWAFGRGEESWLVDVRVFHGDPSLPEDDPASPWRALTDWRRTPLRHESGEPLRASACGIDSGGHHTQAVYAYVKRHQHQHVLALKGASVSGRPILGKPSDVEVTHQGVKLKRGVKVWMIGTDTAKAQVYARLRLAQAGPGFVHFSRNTPADVYEQITAERLVTKFVKGRPRLEWVKPASRRNEQLDLAVYALAMAHYVGLPRFKDGDWARLEARFGQRSLWGDGDSTEPTPGAPAALAPVPVAPAAPAPTIAADDTPPPAPPPGGSLAEPAPPQPAAPPAPAPRPAAPRMRRPGAFGIKRW